MKKRSNFDIVSMKEEHLSQVVKIECLNFDDGWSYGIFHNEIEDKNKHYFVALSNLMVVGYGGYAQILDEAHIMNISVKRDYQNQGIANTILSRIFKDAKDRGVQAVTLEVREGNNSAIRLYEKNGFLLAGIRENYYKNKHNAFIYWKKL